ncbi:hypothetical protein [Henriciella litoralis]|uniref:hypothetical protein n=1 Tax=Henriciella litoralis TaxID=568102 RepID=UPI0009FB98FC|nr:hypothetical protein [Henriciella litoralis]
MYWPVLWHYLRRLDETFLVYAEEGRRFFHWHLTRDGRIWIEYCDESDAERAARGAMATSFDRTPWDRLALDAGAAYASLGGFMDGPRAAPLWPAGVLPLRPDVRAGRGPPMMLGFWNLISAALFSRSLRALVLVLGALAFGASSFDFAQDEVGGGWEGEGAMVGTSTP